MKYLSPLSLSPRHALLLVGFAAAACSESPGPLSAPRTASNDQTNPIPGVGDQLGRLRSITAQFHDFDKTTQPGADYSAQLTGCVVSRNEGEGAMGFHYGKPSLIDGTITPDEPEVLLYEPQLNGKPRLVAVEYIVPFAILPRTATPPRAFNQDFVPDASLPFWTLHIWLWKDNPAGLFASFNPNVNCDAVPAAQRMSHGS
jgi:hypothetical protein